VAVKSVVTYNVSANFYEMRIDNYKRVQMPRTKFGDREALLGLSSSNNKYPFQQ